MRLSNLFVNSLLTGAACGLAMAALTGCLGVGGTPPGGGGGGGGPSDQSGLFAPDDPGLDADPDELGDPQDEADQLGGQDRQPAPGDGPAFAPPPDPDGARRLAVEGDRVLLAGDEVVLRGIGLTCTEYVFKGTNGGDLNLAKNCFATPECGLDVEKLEPVLTAMQFPAMHGGVRQAAVTRVPLTASYYNGEDPAQGACYRQFVGELVEHLTGKGVVTILDLHWNDDDLGQQNSVTGHPSGVVGESFGDMATKEHGVPFWEAVSAEYADNDLVVFELYNEPMGNKAQALPSEVWLDGGKWDGRSVGAAGGVEFAGMRQLYGIVRKNAPDSVIIVGGNNWAYNADDCIRFHDEVAPTNVIYAFHPYQGLGQEQEKTVEGFAERVQQMADRAPLLITEFGQYCCSEDDKPAGPYKAPVESDDVYTCGPWVEDLLRFAEKQAPAIGWVAWGWNPNHYDDPEEGVVGNAAGCLGPDVNFGRNFWGSNGTTEQRYVDFGEGDLRIGGGADWSRIWPLMTGWDETDNSLPAPPDRDAPAKVDKQCAANFATFGGGSGFAVKQYAACDPGLTCAVSDKDWGQCIDCLNIQYAAPFWPEALIVDACAKCGVSDGVCTGGGRRAEGGGVAACHGGCGGNERCVGDDFWRQCVDCGGVQWACGYWQEPFKSLALAECGYNGPCQCNNGDDGCVASN